MSKPARGPLMEQFRNNIGREYTIAEMIESTGATVSGVSGAISSLHEAGWQFTKPTHSSFICHAIGSLAPVDAKHTTKIPKGRKLPIDAMRFDPSPEPELNLAPAEPEPPAEPILLDHGDLLEVIHVSRAGTLTVEDTRGQVHVLRRAG